MTSRGLIMDTSKDSMLAVLIDVQKGKCGLCGKPMDLSRGARRALSRYMPTIEHVVPVRDQTAKTWRGNVIAAHSACNHAKGGRHPTDEELAFLAAVNRALGWDDDEQRQSA